MKEREGKKTSDSLSRSTVLGLRDQACQAKRIGGTKLRCYDSHLPFALGRLGRSVLEGDREFHLARVAGQWIEAHLFRGRPPCHLIRAIRHSQEIPSVDHPGHVPDTEPC